jgi:hypothetical protein
MEELLSATLFFLNFIVTTNGKEWRRFAKPYIHNIQERTFRAHFGIPSAAVSFLWRLMILSPLDNYFSSDHLFWTLYFLKCGCTSWETILSRFNVSDERTFTKWLWYTLNLIDDVLPDVSKFYYYFKLII